MDGSDGKGSETEENYGYQNYENLLYQDEEWEEEQYLPEGWIFNDVEHYLKNVQDDVNLLEGSIMIIDYFHQGQGVSCGWMRTKTGNVHVEESWKEGWVCNEELDGKD